MKDCCRDAFAEEEVTPKKGGIVKFLRRFFSKKQKIVPKPISGKDAG